MFAEKLKYLQGYVLVQLTGYAPERFLNLCSKRNILIWNLEYKEDHYRFCISVKGFKQLKPILRKTKTKLRILHRYGLPFFLHRYRKRKVFFAGIVLCMVSLYIMSLFIWNIEVQGNLHRTDNTILKFLQENHVSLGTPKSRLDCTGIEELLRSNYDDVIWASVKIRGTCLVIDIQENLVTNYESSVVHEDTPSNLIAEKDAEIYSILTRKGTPLVEKGAVVKKGDLLVEGKISIFNDSGELIQNQYCPADADILGITYYSYADDFSMNYEDKEFTGKEKIFCELLLFQKRIALPFGKNEFRHSDRITTEHLLRIGKKFYLPLGLSKEVSKEYKLRQKAYTKEEAEKLAGRKLKEFCEKLEQKGVQIIENNVIIVAGEKKCTAKGELKVIEPIGSRQSMTMTEIQQEGQITDESDRNDN